MSYEVVARSRGCEGGNCPTIRLDKDRGVVAIQGYTPASDMPAAPAGEGFVEMPLSVFLDLASQVQA